MARRPMYAACPHWLIEHCGIGPRSTVVDLGCGSGIVTELLLKRFSDAADFRVIGIDPSQWELDIARSRISDPRARFIQGKAQDALSIIEGEADAVILCSVLHQVPLAERRPVLEGAFALVRPGGLVGANTLFYEGGIEPQTRAFYLRWMAEVRDHLARAGISWSAPQERPVALQRLTPQQHYDLFQSIGYDDIRIEEIPFDWQVQDWEALCRYSVFIQGALSPDVDLDAGSRALIAGLTTTYRALGIQTLRRAVLHCVARRPRESPVKS